MWFSIGIPNFIKIGLSAESYDVIAIFKMAAVSHVGFGLL